jgi:hypothetical protein
MTEHQDKADRLEEEASELERDSEQLGEEIGETRDDWERKKADDQVPGAGGDPSGGSGLPPEAAQQE